MLRALASQILQIFKARDSIACWANLILNHHHSKDFFPFCPIGISRLVTFLLPESLDSGLSSVPSLHHICPVLLLARDDCQQASFQEMSRLLIWCNQNAFIYFPLTLWELDSFPISITGNCKVCLSLSMFFPSEYPAMEIQISYGVPNMSVHLVMLHSNIVQPMLVGALIYFYIPDICFEGFCSNIYQLMGSCKVPLESDSQEERQRI